MNRLVLPAALLALTGCSMTPTQEKWAGFAVGVLIVGAIAAHEADNGKPIDQVGAKDKSPIVPCGGDPRFCK
jgi:hypothetical protein